MTARDDEEPGGADLEIEGFGNKLKLRNVKSVNTILTALTAAGVAFGIYLSIQHNADAKEASISFVTALREQTKALQEQISVQREGNCLQIIKDAEQCRRLTR